MPPLEFTAPYTLLIMMLGSKGQKAVHACMIRLLNLGPAKHEEGVICVANQRIPNVCRIAGAACCGAIRGHQLGAKDLLTPTSLIFLLCMKKYLQETNTMNENNVSDKYRKRLFDVW